MKTIQKWIIILLLVLPVLIGSIILIIGRTDSNWISSSAIKKIGLVRIEGVIDKSSGYIDQLRSLRSDKSIAGVILRVDSPGGAVAPSQEIFSEVMRYKIEKKPLVVSMGNLAASGGYYISSPGFKIFADPGTVTGSIGVIMTSPLFEGLTKKIGIDFRVFKAGKYKDLASPYRQMTDEETKIIQNLLDDTHEQFIEDVAKGRGLPHDSIASIADGRIFTGRQAIKHHLVDTLGSYEDAVAYIKQYTGLSPKAKVVERLDKSTIIREWLTEEVIHVFPRLQSFLGTQGPQYLFAIEN